MLRAYVLVETAFCSVLERLLKKFGGLEWSKFLKSKRNQPNTDKQMKAIVI